MSSRESNSEPFLKPLGESSIGKSYSEVKDSPNFLIRKHPIALLKLFNFENKDSDEYIANLVGGVYVRLSSYGISCPVRFVVGSENGEKVLYAITNRVRGKSLKEEVFSSLSETETSELLNRHYESILTYLQEQFINGEYINWDILRPDQYVYGVTSKDSTPKIYLVDSGVDRIGRLNSVDKEKTSVFRSNILLAQSIKSQIEFTLELMPPRAKELALKFIDFLDKNYPRAMLRS